MAKNDSKVEVLKELSKYIKDGIIEDAIYQAYVDAAKAYGATQKEIEDAIQNGKRAIDVAQKTSQEAVQVAKNAEKIATQSAELISSVDKTQSIVEEKLAKLSRRVKKEQENLARSEQKKITRFRSLGRAGVRLIPGIDHEYEHTATQEDKRSQADKAKLDKMIDKQHRLSVTKIASILTQSDEETLQRLLDSMKGKELTVEYKNIKNKLKEAKKIHSASSASSVRGTGFHKLAETIEKGGFSMDDFDMEDERVLAQKIEQLKILSKQTGYEDIDKALNTFDKNIKTVEQNAERLIKMAQSYENFKKEVGLKGQVTTERSVGFLTQIGDEWVEVVGTLDSFFNELKVLTDFKTGQSVDPKKIGIQTNLLKTALKTMGIDVQGMKALHIPYKSYREGGVYDVRDVDEGTIYQWVSDAFNMYWGKQLQPTKNIPTLMQSKLEPYSFKKDDKIQHTWKLNKRTLKSLERDYDKGWITVDEVANMVEGLSPDDRTHFMNLLWSTKKYGEDLPEGGVESNELYRKAKLWKELRTKLPSFYTDLRTTSGVSEETFIDEEGNVSGATTVGGGFLSQWSKAYRLKFAEELSKNGEDAAQKAAQEVADQFVKIVKDATDEIEQDEVFGKLASLSFKDDIHDAFIDAVGQTLYGDDYEGFGIDQIGINERSKEENAARAIRSQRRAGERYYREQGVLMRRLSKFEEGASQLDAKSPEQVLGFVKGIGSLKSIFQGALNELDGEGMSQLNEAGMPEFIENSEYLLDRWYQFVRIIKEKIKPIEQELRGTARETGDWSNVNILKNSLDNLMLTEDLSSLGVKTAHRFSWLYQAKDIYDEMLKTELPKGMTTEEYAKQRLSEAQYGQYLSSIQLRTIAERSGGSLEELINNFLKVPIDLLSSELAKDVQDSLFKIKEGSPELLSDKFYDIISEQTTISGGESKKLEWWRNAGVIERLRRGEEIRAWDPRKTQEVSVSDTLTSYLDEKIRDIIDSVTKTAITSSANASIELRNFLSEKGAVGGPLNRLMRGDINALSLVPGLNVTAIQQQIEGLEKKRGSVSEEKYQEKLIPLNEKLKEVTDNVAQYMTLLNKSRTIYTEKTDWTRESATETLKDFPEKLTSVLQLIDIYERVKNLPTVTVGQVKDEKTQTTQVETQKTDIDADTVIIGEPEISKEVVSKPKKHRGRAKKKVGATKILRDPETDTPINSDGTVNEEQWLKELGESLQRYPVELENEYFKRLFKDSPDDYARFEKEVKRTKKDGRRNRADLRKFFKSGNYGDFDYEELQHDLYDIEMRGELPNYLKTKEEIAEEERGVVIESENNDVQKELIQTAKEEVQVKKQGIEQEKQIQEIKSENLELAKTQTESSNKMEVSSDGGAGGGDEGGKKPPKSGGRKGKSDEEKAQADTEKRQKQDIREYQQYINRVISLESQIDKLQRQATLSGGKHKDAIYGTIDALNEELGDLNRNNDALKQRVATEQAATKESIDATAALKKQSNAQKNLVSVKGATSIWDMMANDIRRATMRVADFGIAAKILNKIPQDIQKVIQYTKELDAAMTNIRIVSGKSMKEAQEFMRGLQQIAQKTGTTLSELASGANEWLDDCLGHYKLL